MKKILTVFIGFVLFIISCSTKQQLQPIEKTKLMMGTIVQIKVYNKLQNIEQIIEKAFAAMENVNKLASNYIDSSQISIINREAHKFFLEIDPSLFKIIEQSQQISDMTEGAYDITISPLLKLWNYNDPNPQLPSEEEIKRASMFVNYKNVLLKKNKIKFTKQGMRIDLGGIAKGYAVDKAMKVLLKHGIKDALIDAGGDFSAISGDLTKGKRKVWIKHPRQKDRLFGYFHIDNGSVATSGDYERFFFVDSVRYHHIINPKTGYPANESISVTIKAYSAMMADALATAVFLIGPEKGINLINQFDDVEGIIIYEKNKKLEHVVSKGLIGNFFVTDQRSETAN